MIDLEFLHGKEHLYAKIIIFPGIMQGPLCI